MTDYSPFLTEIRSELVAIMHQEQEAAATRTLTAIERVVGKFLEIVSQNYTLEHSELFEIWMEAKSELDLALPDWQEKAAATAPPLSPCKPKKAAAVAATVAASPKAKPQKLQKVEKNDHCIFTPSRGKNKGICCNAACAGDFCTKHAPKKVVDLTPAAAPVITPEEVTTELIKFAGWYDRHDGDEDALADALNNCVTDPVSPVDPLLSEIDDDALSEALANCKIAETEGSISTVKKEAQSLMAILRVPLDSRQAILAKAMDDGGNDPTKILDSVKKQAEALPK